DQNIKPPKTLSGSFDQFLRCSSAGKIAVDGRTVLFPQFFDQPFRLRLGFSVIEHAASPSRHEHPDRRRANAASTSCNHRNLTAQRTSDGHGETLSRCRVLVSSRGHSFPFSQKISLSRL